MTRTSNSKCSLLIASDVPAVVDEVPAGETDTCVAGVDGVVADSACYKKREEETKRKAQQCERPTSPSAAIEDSACY
jgi:hypothetical protein